MTYEEFVLSKVINKDVEDYDVALEAVIQLEVAPSTYLEDKINRSRVSKKLIAIFGRHHDKPTTVPFNKYFFRKYRKEVLGIDVDNLKTCTMCKQELTLDNFGYDRTDSYGRIHYKTMCKPCRNVYEKERFYKKRTSKILEVFGSYSCQICGYDKCETALELHHRDPTKKEFTISSSRNNESPELINELKKCALVCSNCHREIHYGLHPEYLM